MKISRFQPSHLLFHWTWIHSPYIFYIVFTLEHVSYQIPHRTNTVPSARKSQKNVNYKIIGSLRLILWWSNVCLSERLIIKLNSLHIHTISSLNKNVGYHYKNILEQFDFIMIFLRWNMFWVQRNDNNIQY